jgi:hypothetical protein
MERIRLIGVAMLRVSLRMTTNHPALACYKYVKFLTDSLKEATNMFARAMRFSLFINLLMLAPLCFSSDMKNTWSRHDDALIKWVTSGDRVTLQRFAAPIKNNGALEKRLMKKPFLKLAESEGRALLAQVNNESLIAYEPLPNGIWIIVRGVNFLEKNPVYSAHLLEDGTLSVAGTSLGGGAAVHHHLVLIYVEEDFRRVVEFAVALRS